MLSNIKLVVLDYPKLELRNSNVKKLLSDMIQTKQINFERTDINYISMSPHDLIGTHCLIYDTSALFEPQLISSLRISYSKRCEKHNLVLPILNCKNYLGNEIKDKLSHYEKNFSNIIDCGSMFIDASWSFKKSSVPILEIGLMMMVTQLIKFNQTHFLAATNEKYGVSRVLKRVGDFENTNLFTHPDVKDTHLLVMMDQFNYQWLSNCHKKYASIYKNRIEYFSNSVCENEVKLDDKAFFKKLELEINNIDFIDRKSDLKSGKLIAS